MSIPRFGGLPVLGLNHRLLLDPVGMFMDAYRTHGDLVELDLGYAGPVYAAFHPDGVKQVLQRGKRTHRALLRQLLGKGLFTSPSGDDWLRRRRLVQPLFRQERLDDMIPLLLRSFDESLDQHWAVLSTVDAAEEMKRATVAMMVDATFGRRADVDRAAAIDALSFLLPYVDQRLFTLIKPPLRWPTPANRRYVEAIATVRRIVGDALRTRRPASEPTFLDGLLDSRAADGAPNFTDEELVDEVLSIFIAGTETTGTAITWALHLISTHPEVADQLHKEVASVIGTTGSRVPTAVDLADLTWPKAIMQEALRLYPPAWALRRVLDEPTEISGHRLAAGSRLIVSAYVTHRHQEIWPDPELFDPNRWRDPAVTRPRFSYFPFGSGAHQCMGNLFALLEGELILTRIAQHFRLTSPGGKPLRTKATIALAPRPTPRLALTHV
jgi:cytochrome P450